MSASMVVSAKVMEFEGTARLDRPATFVRDARQNGFEPAEAMALYHEKRLILVQRLLAYPLDATWGDAQASDAQLRAAIAAVHTPAQWHAYAERWRTGDLSTRKWPTRALTAWWTFENDGSSGDVPCHFYRRQAETDEVNDWHILPPHQGQAWTWWRVHQTIANDLAYRGIQVRPRPRRWTPAIGRACLVRLMRRIGLDGLEWPWAKGQDADWLWQVFIGLRRTHQRLVGLTGWRGPVFGLGRGLWLQIWPSLYPADREGECLGDGPTPPTVRTHQEHWDAVLPHEWFHYLDALLNQSARQVQLHGPVPVRSLLSEVQQATPLDGALALECAALPEVADHWRQLYIGLAAAQRHVQVPDHHWRDWPRQLLAAQGELSASERATHLAFLDRLKTAVRPDRLWGRQAPKGAPRRNWVEARTEPERLLPLKLSYTVNIPSWWDRCDQATRALARADRQDLTDPDLLTGWWWSEPEERLAMAFEYRLWERWAADIENRPLLPTAEELTAMEPLWVACFAALAPIWERLRHARAARLPGEVNRVPSDR